MSDSAVPVAVDSGSADSAASAAAALLDRIQPPQGEGREIP